MRVLSWNCRGLGNAFTVQYRGKIAKEWKPAFLFFFLLETKLKRGEGKKIDAEMGF